MASYWLILAALALLFGGVGWRSGTRYRQTLPLKLSAGWAAIFLAAGMAWFLLAMVARRYADTDGWGTDQAAWFAQAGKWQVLWAVACLGWGWVGGAGQLPPRMFNRIFFYLASLGLLALVLQRSLPVYFLLGDGRRDRVGILREAETVESTCAAVALANYLERFAGRPPVTEREIARVCGVTMEGTTPAGLLRAAYQYGLTNAELRIFHEAELEHGRLPAIVSISPLPTVHHATLLIGLEPDRAIFIDPAYGLWQISRPRFREIWYGRTLSLAAAQ
ncbi:MAG TPA: cysteine peptidase family C39 domain-containing protein [Verrucomicrobiae bacterium]